MTGAWPERLRLRRALKSILQDAGMPPWERILKPEQLNNVAAYVLSLVGTNPPNPKAPEGPAATPTGGP